MFGFKKKENVEFEATRKFSDYLMYDENRNLIKIKGVKTPIAVEDIQLYQLKYGNKTYDRVDLGEAMVGGALFGVLGIVMAGTHKDEYISNLTIMIKANDKFYSIPMIIGKMKVNLAKSIVSQAEQMIAFLDEITK